MTKKEFWYLVGGVIGGIVFAQQIKRLPLVNKIPTV
jgi:hypothetical protein